MNLKKLVAALTSSALLFSSLSVTGVSAADGDYTYVVNADGVSVTITGCTLYDEAAIEIPESIGEYTVTAIAAGAFDGYADNKLGTNFENVTSVTIPATVTDIDFAAFEDCDNLDSITVDNDTYASADDKAVYSADGSVLYYVVPSAGAYTVADGTVEIAANAMAYNSDANTIKEVTIPASVTTIGRMATVYGSAVTIYGETGSAAETFAASNANVFVAQESVFVIEENGDGTATIVGCTDYESAEIVIPETVDGCTITAIAAGAFDGYADNKLGTNFENVTSITIPATVTDIDFAAFEDCDNLASVVVDNDTYASADSDTAVYSADGSVLYYVVPSAGAYTVADGTVEIAANAMAYNSDANTITEVTIPASVTTIGRMATVYGSAVTIYGDAGSAAETFASANMNNFVANEEIFIIEINEDGTTATLVGCTDYESAEIVIPETYKGYTITAIAASAFDADDKLDESFENLTAVTIPATVEDIDFAAFEDCDNLASITVDNDTYASADNDKAVYSADGSVLYYVIPTIGAYTVADGTEEIAANAMAYNDDVNTITEVTIPASVTTIGRMATVYGSAVTIYGETGSAAETFASANMNNFVADEELFIIEINEDGTTATIVGCTDYESSEIVIPETYKGYTITAIAADAFDGGKMGTNFENLTSVTIPATVEDIDFSAFNDCENLEAITVDSANENYKSTDGDTAVYSADGKVLHYVIPAERSYTVADGTEEIAPYALAYGNENSNNIKDVTIPESVTTIGDFATVYGPAVIIRGYVGSAAETFADENKNTFIGDILYGDADDDGDVDGYDALYCLQASVYQVEPGEINILQGNVDGIGSDVLTSADALLILQYCSMSIDAFPIEG